MYHLVLRQHDGNYVRVEQEELFDKSEVEYFEDYYKQYGIDNTRPYYDNQVILYAVAVNIFQSS